MSIRHFGKGRAAPVMALLVAALAGCGLSGGQTAAGSSPARQVQPGATSAQVADWTGLVAAAKQEGKVTVLSQPGAGLRQVFDTFQAKYGIPVELRTGGPSELGPAISAERKADQYLWDVAVLGATTMLVGYKSTGALDPVRPAMVLPEVLDDSKWQGGFQAGWMDHEKALDYAFVDNVSSTVYINRQVIPESQLNSIDQLWDPKWKGKIASIDPRVGSSGAGTFGIWLAVKGEDKLRSFFSEQQLVPTQDGRQLLDWVLRGQYPIGIGISPDFLTDYARQGLDVSNVKPLVGDDPATVKLSHATGTVGLLNRAPHPNAAKVLINWLLTQDGQATFAQQTGYNVRRLDVPVQNAAAAVESGRRYIELEAEDQDYPTYVKAIQIAKELLK
ncbi:MAG TPA: extracellular solute-binding protein [Chloroflexota bacterium]|nr:extracellular solute-binding protein [Chloroflexota bacterium]